MKRKSISAIFLATLAVLLTGCAGAPLEQGGNPDVYTRGQAMQVGHVFEATIVQVRNTTLSSGGSMRSAGAIAGGLTGLVLTKGNAQGTAAIATLVGGAAGSMLGSFAGKSAADEIVLRLSNNEMRVVIQEKGTMKIAPGAKVYVLVNGAEARIVGQI